MTTLVSNSLENVHFILSEIEECGFNVKIKITNAFMGNKTQIL